MAAFPPGTSVGRFEVRKEVGRGACGVVLRAWDTQLERDVALKLLAPERLADPTSRARFQREATAVSKLKHTHMSAVYELGELGGQPYLVMEWCEGQTLQALLKERGALPMEEAVGLLDQIAQALDYAHKHEVVHRDVKPANIMVNDGQATLVDFGLATVTNSVSVTETGTVLGTPLYMAPEQINGEPATSRSDLYALAVIFYEMVAGKPPFEGEHMASIIYSKVHKDPPRLSDKAPSLGSDLDAVVQKALAREQADRFPTGKAIVDALRQPPPPSAPSVPSLGGLFARLGLFLGLGVLLVAMLMRSKSAPVATPTPTPVALATTAPTATPAAPEKPAWLWQQKTPQLEGMIAAGDRLLAATEDGRLQALDPTSGKTLWEAALKEAPVGAPVVVGPKVYVATESKLQAYALADGTGLWAREEEEPAGLCAAPDGTLYLTVKDQLVAYDAQSEELGRIRFGRAMFAPVCDADRVYAAWPGGLSAVNRKTGKNAWKVKLPGPLALERAHGLILVPTAATLTAFNCTSGAKAWEADLPGKPLGLSTSGDVTVVNCEDGQVVAFERDGTVRWQAHPEIELGVGPQVTEKAVLVAGVKAFHRLDLATGQELETFLTPDAWLPPVAMRDRVFLTASDSVTAYSTP